MSRSILISIEDTSHVGHARREATSLARELGFDQTITGKISLTVTEAGTNIIKHARSGQLLLRRLHEQDINGMEILAIDKGPGMSDIAKCMADGYSTAGSPGTGLGAISRIADYFDIFSVPGKGTVLLAHLWAEPVTRMSESLIIGAICAPLYEQEASGDAWSVRPHPEGILVLVADGLGHGPLAARAADEAVTIFQCSRASSGPDLMRELHGALRSTRGASVAIADLHYPSDVLRFTAVGNISASVWVDGASRSMVSHNGTVGHELHRVREFVYPWPPRAMLAMHSDGILTRWQLDTYPGLLLRHPSMIAAVLFRDFRRPRDDSTILLGRDARSKA